MVGAMNVVYLTRSDAISVLEVESAVLEVESARSEAVASRHNMQYEMRRGQ
jgi:hypothetical protein